MKYYFQNKLKALLFYDFHVIIVIIKMNYLPDSEKIDSAAEKCGMMMAMVLIHERRC
jgi:hypothetical protein